jgi:hypothetical protein
MTLASRIEKDFLAAYKAKDDVRVAVLRMLKTAIKNKHVECGREPGDAEVADIVAKQAKQRQESVEQFRAGGREELAAREERELEVLSDYMPEQITGSDLEGVVEAAIAETGASGPADMGKVMQHVMAAHKGRVDGKQVSEIARKKLAC